MCNELRSAIAANQDRRAGNLWLWSQEQVIITLGLSGTKTARTNSYTANDDT